MLGYVCLIILGLMPSQPELLLLNFSIIPFISSVVTGAKNVEFLKVPHNPHAFGNFWYSFSQLRAYVSEIIIKLISNHLFVLNNFVIN